MTKLRTKRLERGDWGYSLQRLTLDGIAEGHLDYIERVTADLEDALAALREILRQWENMDYHCCEPQRRDPGMHENDCWFAKARALLGDEA